MGSASALQTLSVGWGPLWLPSSGEGTHTHRSSSTNGHWFYYCSNRNSLRVAYLLTRTRSVQIQAIKQQPICGTANSVLSPVVITLPSGFLSPCVVFEQASWSESIWLGYLTLEGAGSSMFSIRIRRSSMLSIRIEGALCSLVIARDGTELIRKSGLLFTLFVLFGRV